MSIFIYIFTSIKVHQRFYASAGECDSVVAELNPAEWISHAIIIIRTTWDSFHSICLIWSLHRSFIVFLFVCVFFCFFYVLFSAFSWQEMKFAGGEMKQARTKEWEGARQAVWNVRKGSRKKKGMMREGFPSSIPLFSPFLLSLYRRLTAHAAGLPDLSH